MIIMNNVVNQRFIQSSVESELENYGSVFTSSEGNESIKKINYLQQEIFTQNSQDISDSHDPYAWDSETCLEDNRQSSQKYVFLVPLPLEKALIHDTIQPLLLHEIVPVIPPIMKTGMVVMGVVKDTISYHHPVIKSYSGILKNGLAHHQGSIYYTNGNFLFGCFENGYCEGKCVIKFKACVLKYFIGNFQKGVPHGWGKLTYSNGKIVQGYFCQNGINPTSSL